MSKRKYRQYTPGRTPGVHSTITAVRDTDLTEVDGRTRLRPGESITFEFDLMAGVRSYTQWKSLARQLACGACTLEVKRVAETAEQVATQAPAESVQVHAISPQEPTAEITRERDVVAAAKAKDSTILAQTIDPQDGQGDRVFTIQSPDLPASDLSPTPQPKPVSIPDAQEASAELPGPDAQVKPSIMRSDPAPATKPVLSLDQPGTEVITPEQTVPAVPAVPTAEATYAPEQSAPTDYSSIKRPRAKKGK